MRLVGQPGSEEYPNGLNSGHPIKVIWMRPHGNYLGHNLRPGPLHTEYLRQFFEIDCRGLPNTVYRISQPRHAQARQLFVEEVLAKLRGQQRNVFNNSLSYSP